MSSKKNKVSNKVMNVGTGRLCRKCNEPTIIRKKIKAPKFRNFYYTQWEFCKKCNAVYFEEKYKSSDWVESERQESFFSSLR